MPAADRGRRHVYRGNSRHSVPPNGAPDREANVTYEAMQQGSGKSVSAAPAIKILIAAVAKDCRDVPAQCPWRGNHWRGNHSAGGSSIADWRHSQGARARRDRDGRFPGQAAADVVD